MNLRTFIIAVSFFMILVAKGNSQVYDQTKLFKLLPEIPSNLSTASYEEESSFRTYCDSIYALLESYEEKFMRTPNSETNTELIMEYYDIRDTILDLHSSERSKYYDLSPIFSDMDFEIAAKNDSINAYIEEIKYDETKKEEVKALEEQIYANRLQCSKKQADIYLQFLKEYRTKLNNLTEKANKSEVLPLPSHLNKNVSYVLINVKNYLKYLSEVYRFNIVSGGAPE